MAKPNKQPSGPGSGRIGRKPGQVNAVSRKAREEAAKTGLLPHEWLLQVMRGEVAFKQKYLSATFHPETGVELTREWKERDYWPTWEERMDAAKAAANYYAPKLAVHMLPAGPQQGAEAINKALTLLAARLPV